MLDKLLTLCASVVRNMGMIYWCLTYTVVGIKEPVHPRDLEPFLAHIVASPNVGCFCYYLYRGCLTRWGIGRWRLPEVTSPKCVFPGRCSAGVQGNPAGRGNGASSSQGAGPCPGEGATLIKPSVAAEWSRVCQLSCFFLLKTTIEIAPFFLSVSASLTWVIGH